MKEKSKNIKDGIKNFIEQGHYQEAMSLLQKYEKVVPTDIDIYNLKAMIFILTGDLEKAKEILENGLKIKPLDFDILYNLGYIYEQKGEFLEAYYSYTTAQYNAENPQQIQDVIQALEGIKDYFAGRSIIIEEDGNKKIKTQVRYGTKVLEMKFDLQRIIERKTILEAITKHLDISNERILEIEFGTGLISKNLNFYGFDVTAIDSRKLALLEIISKEWQDNLFNPRQSKAQFYHNKLEVKHVALLSDYDAIILVPESEAWYEQYDQEELFYMIENIINRVKKQAFIRIPDLNIDKYKQLELLILEKARKAEKKVRLINIHEENESSEKILLIENKEERKYFSIPIALETINSKSDVIEVEIEKCRDKFAFGYEEHGWHPFVALAQEYLEKENLTYEESILKMYYEKFQPQNLQQALLDPKHSPLNPINKGWIGYPWTWNTRNKVIIDQKFGETRPGGNHFFGPNSHEFGKNEFQRIIINCELIKSVGYQPEGFADGYISGYMLKTKGDYRFIVTEGQHRMAALVALGYKTIKCRFIQKEEYPRVVNIKDSKRWPQVINGAYSKKVAEKIFNMFFENDGRERAKRIGLLD
ncbi:TPR repeat-containing protein [Alkaliphilus metalliredigens QYMF]|uniref:TPR repeat-containing protein n=1 Tax=Alkaliphilus metalliredigens (strain QYMF) TaxID=293826 RepID=A6TL90_ALKMQ|nr:tetratricopeptide repeat protein [Alkaliphilus metalliredigens]ABR46958.1 TPR repeat-containing protein [Alkaliphilus metalliredigens QYMF]